jgi:hypothetical protein
VIKIWYSKVRLRVGKVGPLSHSPLCACAFACCCAIPPGHDDVICYVCGKSTQNLRQTEKFHLLNLQELPVLRWNDAMIIFETALSCYEISPELTSEEATKNDPADSATPLYYIDHNIEYFKSGIPNLLI